LKVIAINGSARKDGNTAILLKKVLSELEAQGIETELLQMSGKKITGCTACDKCLENRDGHCAVKKDILNEYLDKIVAADGIILGSPTYFADISAGMKALIERVGRVSMSNGGLLKRKVGAAVVAVRRGGAIHAVDSLNHFFLISQMIIPGSTYWNMGIGRAKGEVENDAEGIKNMSNLGQNMAWLLEKLQG